MFASAIAHTTDGSREFYRLMAERGGTLDEAVKVRIASAGSLQEAAGSLLQLLAGGLSVWTDGRLIETRSLRTPIAGIRVEYESSS